MQGEKNRGKLEGNLSPQGWKILTIHRPSWKINTQSAHAASLWSVKSVSGATRAGAPLSFDSMQLIFTCAWCVKCAPMAVFPLERHATGPSGRNSAVSGQRSVSAGWRRMQRDAIVIKNILYSILTLTYSKREAVAGVVWEGLFHWNKNMKLEVLIHSSHTMCLHDLKE